MKLKELEGKKILILGYGVDGKATHEFLKSKLRGAVIDIADKNLNADYLERQKGYDLAVKTPGIPKDLVTIPYTTSANIFFANVANKVIGITGTKGKSTTASLIHEILKAAGKHSHLIGNIGNPALAEVMKPYGEDDIFVYELSSYVLEDIRYSPHISVVVNLFPEHLDYHKGKEAYYRAKENILKYAKSDDFFVYNPQFPGLVKWAQEAKCKALPFVSELNLNLIKSTLLGKHNEDNIRAALTVVNLFDIKEETAYKAIGEFHALPHRLEYVGKYKEIDFYDDAISTTPESTIAAIEALKNVQTIFLGGQDRGYDFSQLAQVIIKSAIKNIVFFPDSGPKIRVLLEKNDSKAHMFDTQSMKEAVQFAYQSTRNGSSCLLSTASPSYSLWKDFNQKGDEFRHWVAKLGQSEPS